jgi:hypothetical protein
MALTNELLKANTALAGLTDEQITAITTLSKNDEDGVIGTRIGQVYREMDDKISSITGVARNGDEKTYLYLERATASFKEKADKVADFEKQVGDLTATKERLEKTISEGTQDKETKNKLDQANADLASITNQYNTLKTEFDTSNQTHENELFSVKVQNDLSSATNGIAFKKEFPESVTKVMMDQAMNKIKALNPDYIDNGQGGKQLVFKDSTGAPMRNPDNSLHPYTAAELVKKELASFGVLDDGAPRGGGGTNPLTGGGAGGALVVSGAKTRLEANTIIHQSLTAKGLTLGSDQYKLEMNAAWTDNNIIALPEQ